MSSGYIKRGQEYIVELSAWKARAEKARASGQTFNEPKPTRAWVDSDRNKPGGLYNGFIHPLEPFTLAGFVWYQGEGNVGRSAEYKSLFPLMIKQWRHDFQQGDLPFLFVQLPNYAQKDDASGQTWAWQRESQTAARSLPNVGMAVTIDVGDPVELHPANKQEVGRRLALIARKQIYGQNIEDCGPVLKEVKREGAALRIHFTHAKGLKFLGDPNRAFVIAGTDRKFIPAEARIEGDSVVVSAKGLTKPEAVRFDWENDPKGMLLSAEGLPAAPFRSDDW